MKRIPKKVLVAVIVLAVVLAGAGVYAATNYGSQSDPLITKSYLEKVLQPQLEAEVDAALEEAGAAQHSAPGEFAELKLSAGQSIVCSAGGELLLRSGSAKSVGSLTDTTAGSGVSAGVGVTVDHLYLASAADSGFTAGSGGAAVLVSGSYFIN